MDWALWGFVIVVLTLGVTCWFAYVTFSKQFPKRSLTYAVTSSPLLNARTDSLKVLLDKVELKEPYLVYLDVACRSRADISSAAFDAGRPLVFDFGRPVLGGTEADASMKHEANGSQIRFQPQLLRRRAAVKVLFVTEGKPDGVAVDSPLVDIPVASAPRAPQMIPVPRRLIYGLMAVAWVSLMLCAVVIFTDL